MTTNNNPEFVPTVILPDGTTSPWTGSHALEDLQECVGGFVQFVDLDEGQVLIFDEESKLKGKPRNHVATELAAPFLFVGDFVAGTALLTHNDFLEDA